ncbi:acyltransferase, partial [Salmonella enterica subsp. enterica serovar Enteritidis]|nr:acyltransferase [Salmonella enterica]EGK1159152.1 acyltransferase [Salmonella enterica]EHG9823403.1 acyltransferase [Salmonella enterica subsp. enterica serovar Enteritidis]
MIDEKMSFPGYIAIIPVLGASLIIASNGNDLVVSKLLSVRPVVFFGLISYPLYLWHWPIYSFYRSIFAGSPDYHELILLLLSSFFLAILTYYLIEKPLRNARNKYITAILLALSVFGTGLIGAFIFHINGVKDREINKSAGEYASVTDVYNYYKYGELLRGGICHSVQLTAAIS